MDDLFYYNQTMHNYIYIYIYHNSISLYNMYCYMF